MPKGSDKSSIAIEGLEDCPSFQALTLQHRRWVLEYLKDFSLAGATRRSKFKGKSPKALTTQGCRLLANDRIQKALAEVSELVNRGEIANANELREFWTQVMRADIGRVCQWNDGGLTFNSTSEKMRYEDRRLIKKVKTIEKTSLKGDFTEVQTSVEIHDPLKASELLGKSLGIFIDKAELTGKDGSPLMPVGKVVFDFGGQDDGSGE
jgi:phage terminase small subunit